MIEFGLQHHAPADLEVYGLLGAAAQPDHAFLARRAEFAELDDFVREQEDGSRRSSVSGQSGPTVQPPEQTQQLLILAWAMEERQAELGALSASLELASARFGQALGVEAEAYHLEQAGLAGATTRMSGLAESGPVEGPPWRLVIEAMLRFLPEGAVLFCDAPDIWEAWTESGLEAKPAGPEELPLGENASGPWRAIHAEGWRLAGKRRPDPQRPWLDASVVVLGPSNA